MSPLLRKGNRHEQDCVLLPGTGLARGRDGQGHRRGGARGDGGLPGRQRGLGARPRAALLRGAARGARRDRGAAAGARRHEPRGARRAEGARDRAGRRRRPLGRASSPRSRPSPAMSNGEAIALVRERGLAMAEAARKHPGSMAAILGLEDEVVENLCRKILGRVARELQLSRPDRRLRRGRAPSRSSAPRPSPSALDERSSCASRARSTARSSPAPPTGCGRRSTGSASTSRWRRSCRR